MSGKPQERGGCGKFNKKDSNDAKTTTATKKLPIRDEDLKFYIGEQQAEKFDQLIKHLMAEAQKDYGYSVAYIIEYRKEYVFETPTKQQSTLSDEKSKKIQQDTYDSIFAQEIKAFTQKKSEYERNKEKMCGTILQKMSAGLEKTMKKEAEYPRKKGTDPIWLLKKIEYYCKTYRGNKYLPAVYMNAVRDLAEIIQGNNETVSSYTERLKSRMKVFWETMAEDGDVNYPELADKILSEDSNISSTEARKQARERVLAFQLINKANNRRFGDLKEEIQKLESRDVEKYPTTLTKAMETLQDHEVQK